MGEKTEEFTAAFVDGDIVKIEKNGPVGTAITELGGVVTKGKKIEDTGEEKAHEEREILRETLPGGQEITIDQEGTQRDAETGEVILEGSKD